MPTDRSFVARVMEEAVRAFEDAPMCEPCNTEQSGLGHRVPSVCHCTELGLFAASAILTRPLAAENARLKARVEGFEKLVNQAATAQESWERTIDALCKFKEAP